MHKRTTAKTVVEPSTGRTGKEQLLAGACAVQETSIMCLQLSPHVSVSGIEGRMYQAVVMDCGIILQG